MTAPDPTAPAARRWSCMTCAYTTEDAADRERHEREYRHRMYDPRTHEYGPTTQGEARPGAAAETTPVAAAPLPAIPPSHYLATLISDLLTLDLDTPAGRVAAKAKAHQAARVIATFCSPAGGSAARPGAGGGAVLPPDCDLCRELCRVFRWRADIVALVHVHEAHDRLRALAAPPAPAPAMPKLTGHCAECGEAVEAWAPYEQCTNCGGQMQGWTAPAPAAGAAACPRCREPWASELAHLHPTVPAPGAADARAREDAGRGDGLALIAAERARQVHERGCTAEQDDAWTRGELVAAAIWYLERTTHHELQLLGYRYTIVLGEWPFAALMRLPPVPTDTAARIDTLKKAGALIAAEVDRLQRAARRAAGEGGDHA